MVVNITVDRYNFLPCARSIKRKDIFMKFFTLSMGDLMAATTFTAPKNNAERIKTFQKDTRKPLPPEVIHVLDNAPKPPTEDDINREYNWD